MFILVMRTVLYIPAMGHNLIPPFLLREAGLHVDKMPKFQLAEQASIDNHCVYDPETGLQILLQLNRILSYFKMRPLTENEQMHWENYDIFFLTPDGAMWDPHSVHFAEEEAAMVDANGAMVQCVPFPQQDLLMAADISGLYGDNPVPWESVVAQIDVCLGDNDEDSSRGELTKDDIALFDKEDRRFQLAHDKFHEDPEAFLVADDDIAKTLISAMALGSITTGTSDSDLFVDGPAGQAMALALLAGTSGGDYCLKVGQVVLNLAGGFCPNTGSDDAAQPPDWQFHPVEELWYESPDATIPANQVNLLHEHNIRD